MAVGDGLLISESSTSSTSSKSLKSLKWRDGEMERWSDVTAGTGGRGQRGETMRNGRFWLHRGLEESTTADERLGGHV